VAWIAGQAFLNIAAMVAIVPLTGIPLPFISYGGSSLISILVACGILLNISRYA
jgi:cell division protein FtsW